MSTTAYKPPIKLSMEAQYPLIRSILDLPHEVIARILFYRFRQDKTFEYIYPMIMTCREMYYQFHQILYTLKPLFLGVSKHRNIGICSKEGITHLVESRLCEHIRRINLSISSFLLLSSKVYQSFILDNLFHFKNLKVVTVKIMSVSWLTCLNKLPRSVLELELVLVDSIRIPWSNSPDFTQYPPEFQLKAFRFKAHFPITKNKYYKIAFLNKLWNGNNNSGGNNNTSMHAPELVFDSNEGDYYNFPKNDKSSPAIICRFLQCLLDYNRNTLEYIELKMASIAMLFTPKSNFYFPMLKLIIVDQTSQIPIYLVRQLLGPNGAIMFVLNSLKPEAIKLTLTEDNKLLRKRAQYDQGIIKVLKDQFINLN
ncbi:uncharacterized protein J8A68_002748 [[Candida] subhashii]|uniref:Uncharacterized protein n=1 Tax=[Candida] subhashii TaxID=561895 RepID=A0A8J5V0A2_9ASCO|nr:uncharacterized protein J8A68_002748 [[Candida] subhashii]KAG7663739.1 hypothetical protein J8A68_002748 [[Candida] subhashii]